MKALKIFVALLLFTVVTNAEGRKPEPIAERGALHYFYSASLDMTVGYHFTQNRPYGGITYGPNQESVDEWDTTYNSPNIFADHDTMTLQFDNFAIKINGVWDYYTASDFVFLY